MDPGGPSKRWNTRPSNESTGSATAGCWSPSATSRLPKPKIIIMLPQTTSIWQRDSQPNASGKPGAVQTCLQTHAHETQTSSGQRLDPRQQLPLDVQLSRQTDQLK